MSALENWNPLGTLCDDHIHVGVREIIDRRIEHFEYTQKRLLKRMANNQMLSDEYRDVLYQAIYNVDHINWWRNLYKKNINHEKVLREDKSEMTGILYSDGSMFCETCGTLLLTDYLYCSGCGKEVNPFGKEKK